MRLHRLRLTAFGSFPGEEEVDFDALGAAGLFLVHGPTGAGKTTVLDAVCFALYGRVPGHRDSARSLRCDHAPPDRGPSVELEFTLRGRRLRVTRSPAWLRPKLRGEGLKEENAKVVVAELVNGEWVGRTRRLDEAGHLLGELLGMSAEQFWQVAMLPQGDFARFLRATGDERGKLLRHLFSVRVFTDAEAWLAEHRTVTGRERQELAHEVDVLVRRMEEAAGDRLLAEPFALPSSSSTPLTPAAPGSPASSGPEEGLQAAGAGETASAMPGSGTAPVEPEPLALFPLEEPPEAVDGSEAAPGTLVSELAAADASDASARTAGQEEPPGAAGGRAAVPGTLAPGLSAADASDASARTAGQEDLSQVTGAGEMAPETVAAGSSVTGVAGAGTQPVSEDGCLPEEGIGALADPAEDPLAWADGLIARAAALVAETSAACAVTEAREREARKRLEGAQALAERQRRYRDAQTRQAILDEAAEERAELGLILDEAARADRVLPFAQAVTQRAEAATKAARIAVDALARIPLPAPPEGARPSGDSTESTPTHDPEWLSALERERRDEIARLDGLLAEEERLGGLRAEHTALERNLATWAEEEKDVVRRLETLPEERRRNEEELRAARLAAAKLPGAEAAYERATELAEAAAALEATRAALPEDTGDLDRAERDRLDEIARLAALGDDVARLAEVTERLAELEAKTVEYAAREEAARAALEGLPERLAEVTEALTEARNEVARVPAAQAAAEAARARLDAAQRRDELAGALDAAEAKRRDAVDRAQELRERLLEIRQARIEGMAAELARHLVPGEPCAVCGSTEHPAPASDSATGATADDEAEAQARYDEADRVRQELESRCAVLAGHLEQAAATAGETTAAEARDALEQAEDELDRLRAAAEQEPVLAERAERLREELDAAEAGLYEVERLLDDQDRERTALTTERDRLAARLAEACGTDDSVGARRDRLEAEAKVIRAAIDAADRAGKARAAYEAARAAIDEDLATALDRGLGDAGSRVGPGSDQVASGALGGQDDSGDGAALDHALPEAGGRTGADVAHVAPSGAGDQSRSGYAALHDHLAEAGGRTGADVAHAAAGAAGDQGRGGHAASYVRDLAGAGGRVGAGAIRTVPGGTGDEGAGSGSAYRMAEALRILTRLRELAAREPELAETAKRLEAEAARLTEKAAELARRLAAGRARLEELTADIARVGEKVERARGADATLAARLERLAEEADLLREAAAAARQARAADEELAAAQARAEEAAREAGFARLADAETAARTPEEREEMAERLRALDAEQHAVSLLLADPELVAAAAEPEPDLEALEAAHGEAVDAHQANVSARDEAGRRHERLVALRRDLDEACGRLRPAEERHELARRMAELVSGSSPDNPLHIRLSSYVLGERLRQVVDAANERLDHMSGGRYLLLYDQRRSAGDRRKSGGGLGLRVLDGWTGVDRDPATLSGGESFICALALALGLADVVTAEAGGVEIGTLFVDEGFGTLDEDTLDGVLDILDDLRSGGRTVGIVSHVAELRTRIKARLQVDKGRTGSTLRVFTAA